MNSPPVTFHLRASDRARDRAAVTVVVPVHNTRRFVGEAVVSILSQSRDDFILHVHDDGSTDGSLDEVLAVADDRCVVTSAPNAGVSAARNLMIREASTRFIALMDSDDVSPPGRLEWQLRYLEAHPHVGAIAGSLMPFGSGAAPTVPKQPSMTSGEVGVALLSGTALALSGMAGTARAIGAVPFDSRYRVAQDYDWECGLFRSGVELCRIDEPAIHYRVHGMNNSTRRAAEVVRNTDIIKRAYGRALLQGPGSGRFVDWLVWATEHHDPVTDVEIMDSSIWMALGPGLRGVWSERLDMVGVARLAEEMANRQFVRRSGVASASMVPVVARRLGVRPALVGVKRGLASGRHWPLRSKVNPGLEWSSLRPGSAGSLRLSGTRGDVGPHA